MYRLIVVFLLLVCFVFPVVLKAELPFDELALYMSFSQLDGDKVIDESGNKNHGKIEKAKVAKGKYGDAMKFKGEIVFDTTKPSGQKQRSLSGNKLRNLLPDFQFTPIDEGIKQTVDWFINNYPNVRL